MDQQDGGSGGVVAIIPARGGSKGIPRKNLEPVGGVSLIGRAVRSAARASLVDRVVVSTDDDEIATEAASWGADIVRRPDALASDISSSEDAMLHALDELGTQGYDPAICLLIQCTSPFIEAEDIDGTVAPVLDGQADCALTVTESHGFLWRYGSEGDLIGVNHDERGRLRRQDREPEFLETGAVYAMRVDQFRERRHRFFGRIGHQVVPAGRALEIDTFDELALARALAPTGGGSLPDRVEAIVFDFDGVMTDNRATVRDDGSEAVVVDRSDGLGIELLRKRTDVALLVLSKERNEVVRRRCEKLQIEVLHGIDDKLPALQAWADERGVTREGLVYVGNDINDEACLAWAGCAVIPADAYAAVRPLADVVLSRDGGRGAVRELADLVLTQLDT